MARKKQKKLDEQVIRGDEFTIADAKQFLIDARRGGREDFIIVADRSWREIEKRNKLGKMYGGNDLNIVRKWMKFPLWWITLQVRKPLTLARLPVPVLKDTQGDDPYGRTACIIGERLTRGILKTFDAFTEFEASVDDFLVTNIGWGRWYYRREECQEDEKVRLQIVQSEPMVGPDGQPMPSEEPPLFMTPDGEVVENPLEDEMGPYIVTGQQITVDNEEVYFESALYNQLYVDKGVRRFPKVTQAAQESDYSYWEFEEKFGKEGLATIDSTDYEDHRNNGKPIKVFEFYRKHKKEVRWFAENSDDFFQPVEMAGMGQADTDALEPVKEKGAAKTYDNSDLYGLTGFFPFTQPLVINQSTKDIWPTPEYFQVADILDYVHNVVGRLALLTKAIRVRFLFDSSIRELKQLTSEIGEGGGLGVPNLQQILIDGKGDLSKLVAYFPTEKLIEGLGNMYKAFQEGLNMFYQATGMNELLRGQTSNEVEKTYGERQLEGKFALNRMEPFQRKVQEWIKDNYQLGMEMALKMFSDKSLDEYIVPQTLDPEDKQRYLGALDLLKNNKRRRFRVDFETDSTIAINEQWRRQQAIEFANAITKALEATAKTAELQPEIAGTELKVLKHLAGEFGEGKLFVDEIQDDIQKVIDKVAEGKPPEPNYDIEKLKLDGQFKGADLKFKQIELQTTVQLAYAKLAQEARQKAIENQLEQLRISVDSGATQSELQVQVAAVREEIAQGWAELNLKKEALLANIQAEVGKKEMEQFRTILDARVKAKELSLEEAAQALQAYEVQIFARDSHASLQERFMTERRLQEEHGVNMEAKQIDAAAALMDAMKVEAPKPAPISVDRSLTIQVKNPEKKKPTKKDKK